MRGVLWALLAIAGVWLLIVAAAWVFQRQLIYLPGEADPPEPPAGRAVEERTVVTGDGLELGAWWVPAEGEAHTSVLMLPGNAGDRSLRAPLARGLAARGHDVLLLDYRGYGGNPGRPHEAGLVADARAARQHLLADLGVAAERLAYLGESIGTGVAAALAVEHPPAALVLRSPFDELASVARAHYPFLPVGTLLRERFPTDERLAALDVPVLVVAGGADEIVPTAISRRLAARHDAAYEEIPGAGHNDRALLDGERYLDAVDAFLRRHVP